MEFKPRHFSLKVSFPFGFLTFTCILSLLGNLTILFVGICVLLLITVPVKKLGETGPIIMIHHTPLPSYSSYRRNTLHLTPSKRSLGERSRDQGSFDTGKTKRMSSVCISNCIRDTRAPLRATYMNLYKWPESDAEFMRSMSFSGVPHHWPGPAGTAPRVVHSISCRQMYLRSYPFSREEDKGGRRAMCFSCCGKQGGRRDRRKEGRRRTRRPCQVLRKVTDMSLVALFRIFHRLLSCSASVDVVD